MAGRADSVGPATRFLSHWVGPLFSKPQRVFVHHEDLRRANGLVPRDTLTPAFQAALWRNVRRGGRYLSRWLRGTGLEIAWAGTDQRVTIRNAEPTARLSGMPGELLLYLFGRKASALVEVLGPAQAVAMVRAAHFGM